MSRWRGAASPKTVRVSRSGLNSEDKGVLGYKQTNKIQAEAQAKGEFAELSSHPEFASTHGTRRNRRYLGVPGAYTQGSAGEFLLGSMRRMLKSSPYSGL